MISTKFVLVAVILALVSSALGHSYLTKPTSRSDQKTRLTGCRGPGCLGPCDVPKAQATIPAITIARGASIVANWPRNNHAGGFIRFAWAPTANSDDASAFDAGVYEINCHEVGGCKPDDPSNPNGGDSAPADGSYQPCATTISVPPHLTDGAWTLQWAWFGGAFALGDYYSCVDYIISGGPSGAKPTPVFNGGDFTYPGQPKCKFFNTDRLHECVNEPCNNPIYPLSTEESGPAYGIAIASGSTPPPPPPITTGKPVTTGVAAPPVTTGAATTGKPLTTGKPAPAVTTGAAAPPVTTGKPLTTGAAAPPPSGGNSQNCAGVTKTSTSVATVSSVDAWNAAYRVTIQLTVSEAVLSDWRVEIDLPSSSSRVSSVVNAGILECAAQTPVNHLVVGPAGAWANNLAAGSTVSIEVIASNSGMDAQFIQANTHLKVYKL